jgi:hypothetical protein
MSAVVDSLICGRAVADASRIHQLDETMKEHSNYQKKVISRYYENREQIDNQRLSELVTNLYLAEGKKRAKLWTTAEELMVRLKVPKSRIEHVVKTDDPARLAEVVNDLQAGKI